MNLKVRQVGIIQWDKIGNGTSRGEDGIPTRTLAIGAGMAGVVAAQVAIVDGNHRGIAAGVVALKIGIEAMVRAATRA